LIKLGNFEPMFLSVSEYSEFHNRIQAELNTLGFSGIQTFSTLASALKQQITAGIDFVLLDSEIVLHSQNLSEPFEALFQRLPIILVDNASPARSNTDIINDKYCVPIDHLATFLVNHLHQLQLAHTTFRNEYFGILNKAGNAIAESPVSHASSSQASMVYRTSLTEIEQCLEQSFDLFKALHQAIDILTQTLKIGVGAMILLPENEFHRFKLVASNIGNFTPDPQLALAPEHFLAIKIIAEKKEILIIPDIHQSPYEKSPAIRALGIGSGVGLPLLAHDELVGLLFVFDKIPRQFTAEEVNFLSVLANHTAVAITKIKLYQSLRDSKEAAENAARYRADYLARMSHELRAPLAAINNLSELLSNTALSSTQTDYLNSIRDSATHLLALINDVLDFSRLEATRLELRQKEFSLVQIIESSLNLIAIPAAQKNLDLAYQIDDDVPETIIVDPNRLGQILTNLLTNAIKFTEKGNIIITVKQRATNLPLAAMIDSRVELLFGVHDTGIGISSENQKMIFEPFSQVGGVRPVSEHGSGLGLSICKHLTALMDGDIWVESGGIPGQGSTFFFTIQTTAVHTPEAPYRQPHSNLLAHKRMVVYGEKRPSLIQLIDHLEKWEIDYTHCSNSSELSLLLGKTSTIDLILIDERSFSPVDENILLECIEKWKQNQFLPVIIFTVPNTHLRKKFQEVTTTILQWPLSVARLFRTLTDALQYGNAVTRPQPVRKNVDILLVDDDQVNLAAVQLLLNRLGCTAETANNGSEALEKFSTRPYNLVIMDMHMTVMDGYATSRAIRDSFPSDQQPIIAILTAGVSPQQLNALQSSGIDAYIEKPISTERLMNLVELARSQTPDQPQQRVMQSFLPNSVSEKATPKSGVNSVVLTNLLRMAQNSKMQSTVDMIEIFMQSAPAQMDKALKAVEDTDMKDAKSALHALRGTCEIFGAEKLSELCRNLENDMSELTMPDIAVRVEEILAEFQNVKTILQSYRTN
jgi:signal transduction histidine kinase/CheY-like chemotaxis protein